jgi:hypothetical protein
MTQKREKKDLEVGVFCIKAMAVSKPEIQAF